MGRLVYWIAVNAYCSLLYKTMDPGYEPSSLPFAFLLSIENMGSTLCLFMFMRFLLLLSSFYPMVANSSSFMQQPLCHDSESSALLQFKQSFLIDGHASDDPSAYPKVAMWKSHGEGEGEGEVIDAHEMVLSVIGRLVMSSAFTLPEVVSLVLSTPAAPS